MLTAPRKFTIHPDEIKDGTVRRTPLAPPSQLPATPLPEVARPDLFAASTLSIEAVSQAQHKPSSSPARNRRRLSSQTFVKGDITETIGQQPLVAPSRNLNLFPSDNGYAAELLASDQVKPGRTRRATMHVSPLERVNSNDNSRGTREPPRHAEIDTSAVTVGPIVEAQTPANPQKPANESQGKVAGVLANRSGDKSKAAAQSFSRLPHSRPHVHVGSRAKQKAWHPGNVLEREATWPTDSMQDSSSDDDVWLSSESSGSKSKRVSNQMSMRPQRTSAQPILRSQAATVSKSKDGAGASSRQEHTRTTFPARPYGLDGSTDEGMMTAATHLSPDGTLSPSSADVRQLFPRSSSLSPRRKRRNADKRSAHVLADHLLLNNVAARTGLSRIPQDSGVPQSPWAKAKARKEAATQARTTANGVDGLEDVRLSPMRKDMLDGARIATLVRSPEFRCFDCARTDARVVSLEFEVASLKSEIVKLRTIVERRGYDKTEQE